MTIKKILALLLAAAMLFSLAACAGKDDGTDDQNPSQDSVEGNGDTGTDDDNEGVDGNETGSDENAGGDSDGSDAGSDDGETEGSFSATASMEELMDKILDGAPGLPSSLSYTELTQEAYEEILELTGTAAEEYPFADWYKSYTFIDPIDGAEGICAEPMMSSVAFSVVLIRVPDGADAESAAAGMKENCDPRKWICVSADHVDALSNGNLAVLIMVGGDESTSQERFDTICDNFNALS